MHTTPEEDDRRSPDECYPNSVALFGEEKVHSGGNSNIKMKLAMEQRTLVL